MIAGFASWSVALAASALLARWAVRGAFGSALATLLAIAAVGMAVTAGFPTQAVAGTVPIGVVRTTEGHLHDLGSGAVLVALLAAALLTACESDAALAACALGSRRNRAVRGTDRAADGRCRRSGGRATCFGACRVRMAVGTGRGAHATHRPGANSCTMSRGMGFTTEHVGTANALGTHSRGPAIRRALGAAVVVAVGARAVPGCRGGEVRSRLSTRRA